MRARTGSRSAPGTISAGSMPGGCRPRARRRTALPGRSVCGRDGARSSGSSVSGMRRADVRSAPVSRLRFGDAAIVTQDGCPLHSERVSMDARPVRRFGGALLVLVFIFLGLRCGLGGGRRLEDRTTAPTLPPSALEVVADLDYPPGNIAVSKTGRIFFTLHPNGDPPIKLVELAGGKPVPYPDEASQTTRFDSPLAVRIDRQGRLWTLAVARYGRGQPRLLAFDLATNALVHQYDFPSSVAGFLPLLNDFHVDLRGEKIYIAETSPIRQH